MKRTIAAILALMMLALCAACGAKEEPAPAEVVPAAAPAGEAVAGDASAEASGEIPAPDFYVPTDAYAKDFEGYRQYVIDAFATDPGAPADLKEAYNASFEMMTEETMGDTSVANLIDLGLIVSYEDFLNY